MRILGPDALGKHGLRNHLSVVSISNPLHSFISHESVYPSSPHYGRGCWSLFTRPQGDAYRYMLPSKVC